MLAEAWWCLGFQCCFWLGGFVGERVVVGFSKVVIVFVVVEVMVHGLARWWVSVGMSACAFPLLVATTASSFVLI